jgi:radical SAM superfamily enzyme
MEKLDILFIAGFKIIDFRDPEKQEFFDINIYNKAFSISPLFNMCKDSGRSVKIYLPELFKDFDEVPIANDYFISLFYYEKNEGISLIKYLKKRNPLCNIFVGGLSPTVDPEYENLEEISYINKGEGITFLKKYLEKDFLDISYVLQQEDFYMPRELNIHLETSFKILYTSLGCPFSCSMCCNNPLFKKLHSQNEISLKKDIDKLLSQKDTYGILLSSGSSSSHPSVLKRILDYIYVHENWDSEKNFLILFINPHQVTESFIDLLERFRDKISYILSPGIENFDNNVLEFFKRKDTQESLISFFDLILHKNHSSIKVINFSIIFGSPFDTEESLLLNINLLKEIQEKYKESGIRLVFNPLMLQILEGSELFETTWKNFLNFYIQDQSGINYTSDWKNITEERMRIFERTFPL